MRTMTTRLTGATLACAALLLACGAAADTPETAPRTAAAPAVAAVDAPPPPGVRPVDDRALMARIVAEGDRLIAAQGTAPMAALVEQLARKSASVALPAEPTQPAADPEGVYERAQRATLVIGGLYKCDKCAHTHARPASGFVLTASGVAVTNYHVMDAKDNLTVVAMTHDGRVLPVKEVLAADRGHDVAVIQLDVAGAAKEGGDAGKGGDVDAGALEPLPLGAQARPGADVFVMSHPDNRFFSFTRGTVSRYYHAGPQRGNATMMQITADFARGSSGGPVLDARGQAVGMVASTSSVYYNNDHGEQKNLQMVFKECVTADAIRALVQQPQAAAGQDVPAPPAGGPPPQSLRDAVGDHEPTGRAQLRVAATGHPRAPVQARRLRAPGIRLPPVCRVGPGGSPAERQRVGRRLTLSVTNCQSLLVC